ncbi:hypothetical protein JNUCC0626_33670 [Lentzea sp. JNUCC 0626]|uniref:hypothetical protein n=1 Tax=Lentzea sp. JNUCC 0626 TaxID=3367513 RepID=UPI003749BB6A
MRKRVTAAFLGGLALVMTFAAPSQAAEQVPAPAIPPCWTTFFPDAPQGEWLEHNYKNCNRSPITVGRGYVNGSGQITVIESSCTYLEVGHGITWLWQTTIPGVNYQTVICNTSPITSTTTPSSSLQCWTTFFPGNPNGGPMSQYYKNCNGHEIKVATARSDASGQITFRSSSCQTVPAGGGVEWEYPITAAGSNYHTVICLDG